MKKGWECGKLGSLCEKITDGTHQTPTYFEEGFLFLSSRNVTSGEIDWQNVRFVDEAQHLEMQRRVSPRINDILLAKNGTTGVAALVDRDVPFDIYVSLALLRPKEALVPRFLLHFINSPLAKEQFTKRLKGIGVPNLHLEEIREVQVSFPKLRTEQQRLVAILDQAFEAIATAKANAEKNLRNARALFEGHLQSVFTQRGPEWDRVTLETLLTRGWIESHLDGNHGADYPRKEEFITQGVPYISANCLIDERVDMSRGKYLSPERAALLRKGIAKNNDVLFAHNATVGPVAILSTDAKKVILGTSLTYYRCNPKHILPEYLAHYMRSFEFRMQYLQVMRQSTRNQVPITKQREFFHIIPPLDEQRRLVVALNGLFENSARLENIYARKLTGLESLKKSLLHQAFSGEL